jgi:formate hydrogenlyase subunit 4
MGASREAAFSALAEPALFLALLVVGIRAGGASFASAYASVWGVAWWQRPELLAAAVVLFAVMLAESSRIPIDDPNTHLELTMVHEVMVLDHGGPDLAYVLYGSALKLFLFASLIVHLLLPLPAAGGWLGVVMLVGGALGVAVAIGIVESTMARLRLLRVPQFLVGAAVLAAVGVLVTLVGSSR